MKDTEELPITDPAMTRFMITLDQGIELVWKALKKLKVERSSLKKYLP